MSSKGKLIRWNDDRGFGFIKSESLKGDIFIHISALKSMSRKPRGGDIIYFDIVTDKNGKKRAENARIEGVPTKRNTNPRSKKSSFKFNIIILILLGMVGSYIFQAFSAGSNPIPNTIKSVFEKEDFTGYRCEGKQHCSQMNSCKEARFYLQNCPNVKIDGNHDGVPCEMQWCN